MAANGGVDQEIGAVRAVAQNGGGSELPCDKLMLELRKYLLLLAILAATVTYAAALNPPGGVWLDTKGGHLTGNQILVVTYHARYNAFSYSNATAFMASAVVILLLVFGFSDKDSNSAHLFVVLRVVMVLDLLALVVAYAAGASRDTLTTVIASLLVSLVFLYVLVHVVRNFLDLASSSRGEESKEHTGGDDVAAPKCSTCKRSKAPDSARGVSEDEREDKRKRKILMLLAIFATTITYTAGLNPPGGFWPDTADDDADGHRAGDPVLQHHHRLRFAVFFICNTISFVASLFVIMLLLTNRSVKSLFRHHACMVISLLGLVAAYAAGSCREKDSTAGVLVLYVVGSTLALVFAWVRQRGGWCMNQEVKLCGYKIAFLHSCLGFILRPGARQQALADTEKPEVLVHISDIDEGHVATGLHRNPKEDKTPQSTPVTEKTAGLINTAPSLVLLLATLAATVTYQAGLNPPGGFWPDHRDGHKGGDPILFSKHATRYRLFFYCNSTALAASLVVILMVLRNYLSTWGIKNKNNVSVPDETPAVGKEDQKKANNGAHMVILEVVMILDLIGLIGAFAAGCCRDVSTSIYVVALGGGALVYVVFHIVFFTLHHHDLPHEHDTEEKRKLLLLLAILAVTLTYQAGLTPPGGFWLEDDDVVGEVGHHAGDPVLLSNYPHRYTAFFYLNATGFMASVALTILLVNPNLYRAGIKCYALHVCMVAGLFGLMGAYAAGSSRHLRTSIYMIALIVLVFTFVTVLLLVVFKIQRHKSKTQPANESKRTKWIKKWLWAACCHCMDNKEASSKKAGGIELHTQRRYLMLLGILAASVTYQAGLAPPGGVWPDNNDGHAVGNPILRDSSHHRYHMFFYCNSASFVASVVVITLQLLVDLTSQTPENIKAKSLIQTAQWMMVLDLVGLLLAYAAGSTREWETSGYFVALLVAFCIVIDVVVSFFHKKYCGSAASEAEKNHTLSTV